MTLHVALVCDSYVLQIGDRLLSQEHGRRLDEWEPLANKSILVLAENGLLAIGYAGLAHIDRTPTDEWLVEKITDEPPLEGPSGGKAVRHGPRLHLTIGGIVRAISTAIETDLPRQAASRAGLEILITGWTWRRDVGRGSARPRTYARMIQHDGVSGHKCVLNTDARVRLHKPYSRGWDLLSIGAGTRQLLTEITTSMQNRRTVADDVEKIIADAIRDLARQPNSGVGTDLMSIYLPITAQEDPRIRFLRDDVRTVDAYSPAVLLTAGMIMYPMGIRSELPPSIVYGGTEDEPREIKLETVPPLPGSSVVEMWAQPRRPYPS